MIRASSKPSFDEQLRQALQPQPAPQPLRNQLLSGARKRRRLLHQAWAAAALVVLALVSALWAWKDRFVPSEGRKMAQAALLHESALGPLDFVMDPHQTSCSEHCRRWSPQAVGFQAELPPQLANQPIQGGKACQIEGCAAACYRLRDGRSLYVFKRRIQGLGEKPPTEPLLATQGRQVRAWTEGERSYLLVEVNRPEREKTTIPSSESGSPGNPESP